jgi:SAM-dependent methyltransferase
MLPTAKYSNILSSVEGFFTSKVRAHGATPAGADFNSAEAQQIRFNQLVKLIDRARPFRVIDYGCGYGAFFDYLKCSNYQVRQYLGFDISMQMIAEAKEKFGTDPYCAFTSNESDLFRAEYVISSGIFNLKLGAAIPEWESFIRDTIDRMAGLSIRGFAFNMLTSYSQAERQRADLYYADPRYYFDYCKTRWARNVALLHDYDLYDWTILVKRDNPGDT